MRRYSVKTLTMELERLLFRHYPNVVVEGEVSQMTTPASGHCYLTLKEGNAVLNCVIWSSQWRGMRYRPQVGVKVSCRGKMGVYGPQGRHQLYVNVVEPVGEGWWAKRIREIRGRLERDGLLDARRKRALPAHPRVVGVATSLHSAALQDFLKVSRDRFPATRVLVAGCKVTGEDAPGTIVRAMELLLEDGRAEVIVLTRGGGAKEDLLPFMDEQLARFIAMSPVPVLSAVGHQIDTTIADLVADAVAPTPSAAAVAVLPDRATLVQQVDGAALALEAAMDRRLRGARQRVEHLSQRLRHPSERLRGASERANALQTRLHALLSRRLDQARFRLDGLHRRLEAASTTLVERRRSRFNTCRGRLVALSPQGVLDRGYAIVTGPSGVVTAVDEVEVGDEVLVRIRDGRFGARVSERGRGDT